MQRAEEGNTHQRNAKKGWKLTVRVDPRVRPYVSSGCHKFYCRSVLVMAPECLHGTKNSQECAFEYS